ncbi:spore cortex biosynthesis protein YabQ [Anaerosolibacter carboniphilus]|uniref:Spore cortex biosynthesis protein YabQ n=1 Tax=Anaerosolibacter carboniphilus TaxID=1417629 RepID=A0A841L1H7_9FIRM|nr:spore cortex biosynthesis protein YabQ [Anaerosolibacter carboniphilus]MBB6218468.1 spore cortex biosynthesis protein YabQ [Anaerosolibacter carboniphilus]
MATSVAEQVYVFLATMYGGILIGFVYDLYRILRLIFKPKKIATLIQDLIFWIVISGVAIAVLLFSNSGQLRFYTFLGFVMGSILYNQLLSNIIIKTIVYLLSLLKKTIMSLINKLVYPIKILIQWSKIPWRWAKKKLMPIYYRWRRIATMPKRIARDVKKYIKTVMKKK